MTGVDLASGILLGACTGLAWPVRTYRPLAWTLTALLVMHLGQVALDTLLPHYPGPYVGTRAHWERVEIALRCAWPGIAVIGAAATVTRSRTVVDVPAALWSWGSIAAIVAASYPRIRGDALLALYRNVRFVAVAAFAVGMLVAWRRPRGAAQWSAIALVAGMAANTLAGAWAWGNVVRDWPAAQMISVMTYVCVAALLGRDMMFARRVDE